MKLEAEGPPELPSWQPVVLCHPVCVWCCRGRKRQKSCVVVFRCVWKALARTMSLGFCVLAVGVNAVCAQELTSLVEGNESVISVCYCPG